MQNTCTKICIVFCFPMRLLNHLILCCIIVIIVFHLFIFSCFNYWLCEIFSVWPCFTCFVLLSYLMYIDVKQKETQTRLTDNSVTTNTKQKGESKFNPYEHVIDISKDMLFTFRFKFYKSTFHFLCILFSVALFYILIWRKNTFWLLHLHFRFQFSHFNTFICLYMHFVSKPFVML